MTLPAIHALAAAALIPGVVQATAEPVRRSGKVEVASAAASQKSMTDLFDRWERVWNEDQMSLFDSCVGDTYTRHDENGDETVTRAAYAANVKKIKSERPGIRVIVYDHGFVEDRAWFRFALNGQTRCQVRTSAGRGCNPTVSPMEARGDVDRDAAAWF